MSKYDWELIRARWEAGESANSIAREPDQPSRQAIDKHAKAEQWQKHVNPSQVVAIAPPEVWDQLNDKQKVVVNAFALGCKSFRQAALRAGVGESTVSGWKKDDNFRSLCEAARLRKRDAWVASIEEQGERDWRAHAFLLKSLHAEEFGEQNRAPQVGNQFNILGGINLGIERRPREVIDAEVQRVGQDGGPGDSGNE